MNFWWVSHNQTYSDALKAGFLWSPKFNQDNSRNYSYDNMTSAQPGDIVFSYARTRIQAVGLVQKSAFTAPKPFVGVGSNWSDEGWHLDVEFELVAAPFRLKESRSEIASWIGQKYSPLQANGDGNMAYLSAIPEEFGFYLLERSELNPKELAAELSPELNTDSDYETELEIKAKGISGDLEKIQIVNSRRGQGVFKYNVRLIEDRCRVTNVRNIRHLRASHIKPWAKSNDIEKLDGNNGLLLAPHVDHLFDGGYISFEKDGKVLVSSALPREILFKWSLSTITNVGRFLDAQAKYLDFHQHEVFKS